MLTGEENERLTRVGPGTPMGELLRRYWHPVAASVAIRQEPVMAVRLLGENLALYRAEGGELGLVAERCPHRGASLAYGIPEEGGLRCPYHGWKFDPRGQCIEQPAEPADSSFKHRIRVPAYPVQEMGGLVWAYLGPEPAPELPGLDLFVRDDLHREIGVTRLPCSWLQCMENSLDPVHVEYLHATYWNYLRRRRGEPEEARARHHVKIGFDVWEMGITKRRLLEGQSEDEDDWKLGHPILFPYVLAQGSSSAPTFQIRVPVDDANTLHFWYFTRPLEPHEKAQKAEEVPCADAPYRHADGRLIVDTVNTQDMMAWVTQGPISDRTTERLGSSDKGVILYRNVLFDQMERVARGEDPIGIIRDPEQARLVTIPREHRAHYTIGGFVGRESALVTEVARAE